MTQQELLRIYSMYLPYGLKGILTPQKEIVKLTGIYSDAFNMPEVVINYGGCYALSRFKSALIPLSDLTKEIEHEGDIFVPIEKLIQFCTNLPKDKIKAKAINGDLGWGCEFGKINEKPIGMLEYYSEGKVVCYYLSDKHKSYAPVNQKKIFNKLIEWHFDIENLIGKGLAVNKNEIK